MCEIPEDMIEDVNKIVEKLLKYQNTQKLSWTEAYKDVLKKLNMDDKIEDHKLLSCVVTKITVLGYDIIGIPFKLDKFL